jgi:acyl-coenzyme A synthetase/AMP-(fatty) acid ligase
MNRNFPNVILNDTWWQTENGWPIGSNMLNQNIYGPVFPTLPGSVTKVIPGWDIRILND